MVAPWVALTAEMKVFLLAAWLAVNFLGHLHLHLHLHLHKNHHHLHLR
jgi:hypothetical protein